MGDSEASSTEDQEDSGLVEMACLGIIPDVVINEGNPDIADIEVTPDIHLGDRSPSYPGEDEDMQETYVDESGRKLCVPEGLEIIPIYSQRAQCAESVDNTPKSKFEFLKCDKFDDSEDQRSNLNPELGEPSTKNYLRTNLKKPKYFEEDSEEENTRSVDKDAEDVEMEPLQLLDSSIENSSISEVPKNDDMDSSNTSLEDQEVARTNLEMLIGQRPNKLFYCKLCDVDAKTKQGICQHINSKHASRKEYELSIKCPFCPYKNINKYKLENHIRIHSKDKPFQCEHCGHTTSSKALLKKHVFTHAEFKPFKCDKCTYMTNEKYKMRIHIFNQHTAGVKPFQCYLCEYSTADKWTLKRHLMVHSETKQYSCDECAYTANRIHDLHKHQLTHSDNKLLTCLRCPYTCAVNSDLREHMKTHKGEKLYKCPDCKFATVAKYKLIEHSSKHKGQLPFSCSQCAYTTAEKFEFEQHMNTHAVVREFKCDSSEDSGTSNNNLQCHSFNQDSEPVKCSESDSVTKESGKLKKHSKKQNKLLPTKCPFCDFNHFNNYTFKKHLLTNHREHYIKEYTFSCADCDMVFTSKAKLKDHVMLHLNVCPEKKDITLVKKTEVSDSANKTEVIDSAGKTEGTDFNESKPNSLSI